MDAEMRAIRRDLVVAQINRNFEYSEAILKWCVTSLVALNGGALLALVGVDDIRPIIFEGNGYFFGGGILLAVSASFLFSLSYSLIASEVAEKLWKNDILSASSYKEVMLRKSKGIIPGVVGMVLTFGSALALIIGCLEISEASLGMGALQ